jgi:hypothetical protein
VFGIPYELTSLLIRNDVKTLPLDNPRADKEPWRLWRYALAIVVAPVLGNVTAAIPAICLDIMAQRQITTPSSGDLTIPNTLYYCFMGGATGFFAGWITWCGIHS